MRSLNEGTAWRVFVVFIAIMTVTSVAGYVTTAPIDESMATHTASIDGAVADPLEAAARSSTDAADPTASGALDVDELLPAPGQPTAATADRRRAAALPESESTTSSRFFVNGYDTSNREEFSDEKVVRGLHSEFEMGEDVDPIEKRQTVFRALQQDTTCPLGAREVSYNVSAINVDIPINQFGDHDPLGRMYVLDSKIDEVRAQEQSQEVSAGLNDDPIQPLVIRANLGDCLTINFTNRFDNDTSSLHIHRGGIPPNQSGSNVGNNSDTTVAPGNSTTYTFHVENDAELEGAWYFHSHGRRDHVKHGLFGALMVEPEGSSYLDPETREPLESGWAAIIDNGNASESDFREFAIFYHAIGDDTYRPLDKNDSKIPLVDPKTDVYRPCTKALNYRSACFFRRMQLLDRDDIDPRHPSDLDESLGYADYMFGQPGTPIPRTYKGDPTKFRIVGGGSEMRHVHHLHGGGIRWRFQPNADPHSDYMFRNLTKDPPDPESASQRLDSQGISTGETYTNEIACGAGGCQRAAGDFLFHCHLADHYIAGMWSYWRNFDTKQDDLAELPDREGETPEPVNSTGLIGETVDDGITINESNVDDWVQDELPPQGTPEMYDPTVWDWKRVNTSDGPLYLGEPNDNVTVPTFSSENPGERPEILFNPENGRPAFPMLRPHIGERPPFARTHGPAPYLTSTPDNLNDIATNSDHATEPDDPKRGADQLCPAGSDVKRFNIVAIDKPVNFNGLNLTDHAEVYVLAENKEDMLSGERPTKPLVYRANVGDCVEVTLTSELPDNDINHNFSKVNIHPHFVQFDTQASDGVISGASFEQSVRNYRVEDTNLSASASAGDTTIAVDDVEPGLYGYKVNATIAVGLGTNDIEIHRIESVDRQNGTITFEEPLVRNHTAGTAVGAEFVRYKYYIDANFGTVFFHDHVNAPKSFPRGLIGALVVQPPDATYHDPETGEEIRQGTLADIHTDTPNRISEAAGGQGESYREAVMLLSDDRHEDLDVGSWINLRAEPFDNRDHKDTADILSSVTHGDPATDVVRAYEGDPIVFRVLNGAPNDDFSFRLTGHRFRLEHFPNATPRQSIHLGASERFDLMIDGGAGPAGDYLYYAPQAEHFSDGMWGVFRVHDTLEDDLQPLPDRSAPPEGDGFPFLNETGDRPPDPDGPGNPCPADAPVRQVNATAFATDITFHNESGEEETMTIYTLAKDKGDVESGKDRPHPFVLRAAAGECVELSLKNKLDQRVTMQMGKTTYDPQRSGGINVGFNFDQSIDPDERRTYRVYVDEDVEAGFLTDFAVKLALEGDDVEDSGEMYGLYGAIATAPENSTFHDPKNGEEISVGWRAVVNTTDGAYRDYVLTFQEQEPVIGTHQMPYREEARGVSAINYRSEPFETRLDDNEDLSKIYDSDVHGDPETPLVQAYEGEPVKIHAVYGFGFQEGVFHLQGHRWPYDDRIENSILLSDRGFAPSNVVNANLDGGAGPPGDYLYQNHRMPLTEDGQWGIFRVYAEGDTQEGFPPLSEVVNTTG